jgi:hypothetical protein
LFQQWNWKREETAETDEETKKGQGPRMLLHVVNNLARYSGNRCILIGGNGREGVHLEIGHKDPEQARSELHHVDHWSDGPDYMKQRGDLEKHLFSTSNTYPTRPG